MVADSLSWEWRFKKYLEKTWVILLNLVHCTDGSLPFLAIFYNVAANEHWFCPKLVKYQ